MWRLKCEIREIKLICGSLSGTCGLQPVKKMIFKQVQVYMDMYANFWYELPFLIQVIKIQTRQCEK